MVAAVLIAAAIVALSPSQVLFFRLGVPVGSVRMQRLQRTIENMDWKDISVFEDTALLDRRVATLESALGPEPTRIVVLRAPLLLASDLENSLVPRIAALKELLPGIDVPTLVTRAPALLSLDLAQTIEPRVRLLEKMLPSNSTVARTVRRAPTLLQLADLEDRLAEISRLLPGVDTRQLVSRAPSLLAYTPDALRRKLDELAELFGPKANIVAMVKREPAVLTYNVPLTIAGKVGVYEQALPGVDVRKLLATTPRLLSYNVAKVLPKKLEALNALLPGADVPRLIKNVPQLLEYDVDGNLAPKLQALRALFHPVAAGAPPPAPNAAQRLATSKLLAGRRPGRSPLGRKGAQGRPVSKAASARAKLAARGGAAGGGGARGRSLTTVGLLRLAAFDMAVVEKRLEGLSALLPEVDTIALVGKQPSLLRRDVDGSLRPRLLYLTAVVGNPEEAAERVLANPRLLMSSWGVLARLGYVREHVPGALSTISLSTAIMTPKADFGARFPRYATWLRAQIDHATKLQAEAAAACPDAHVAPPAGRNRAKKKPKASITAATTIAKLEDVLSSLLEERVAAGGAIAPESFATVTLDVEEGAGVIDARKLGLK